MACLISIGKIFQSEYIVDLVVVVVVETIQWPTSLRMIVPYLQSSIKSSAIVGTTNPVLQVFLGFGESGDERQRRSGLIDQ